MTTPANTGGGIDLGGIASALVGPAIGQSASRKLMHGIDVGVGTTAAALTPSVIDFAKHPIGEAEKIKKRGLVTSTQAAAEIQHLGTQAIGKLPSSVEVVAPAGAAGPKRPVTIEEYKRLEAQGYDLKPSLRARFLKNAAKNGWNPAELDNLSGSALIDKAFTKPPAMPLRIAANFAGGVAKLGTLPAGVEGAIRETAAGHGGDVAKALGEGLISEIPGIGKHSTKDTVVADPFGFITQFAGAGKTAGSLTAVAKAGLKSAAKPRVVESAASGLRVERGLQSPNAWTATGEAIADKAAGSIPRIGKKLEAEVVDKAVRRAAYKHAPAYVKVQRPYKAALDKVGHKRAAELSAYQMSGGKPEQLAAFYRSQGNTDNAKFFEGVAKNTKTLNQKDHAFLDAHQTLAQKTTQANIDIGKFGPVAAQFRAYSPLIRSSAHLGDPDAQRVLALRDEYLKGFNTMEPQDLEALRGAIDQGVMDFAKQHKATPESLIAKAQAEHAAERARIEASAPKAAPAVKRAPVPRSVATLTAKLEKEFPGVKLTLSDKGEYITLARIELPKEARGKGTGSEIMARIHAYADAKGKTVALTPSNAYGGSVPRLKKFYKRHGYVPNTGRNKNWAHTESMHRTPSKVEKPAPAAVAKVDLSQAHAVNDARLAARIEQAQNKTPGIEPTYVEYSQPRPLIAPPYKPGPGGATGFKKPRGRQKAETGATFESGKYLIDPKAPLVESVRAQRAHLADVLHEDVANAVGKPLRPGDVVPKGYVAVSKTNLRGLKQTVNDLTDNPVSAPAYDEFAAQKQGIFDRLMGSGMPEGEHVKKGANVIAIPIGSWKRILDHTRPPSRTAYDRFMQQYQRVLVSYRPSTAFNNFGGGAILAATGGAMPIGTGTKVLGGAYRDAYRAMRDPTLGPAVARGHGVAGSFAPNTRSTLGAGFDWMRNQSARAEDFFRLATFFSKAGSHIKKQAKALNMSADEYQRAFVAGNVDEAALDKFLNHMEKFTGEMLKPDGKLGRAAGRTMLFHKWMGHMAKLILYTLPVEHPRRLAVLNALSDYGDQYRQEHGVWPDWYASYLPLFQHIKRIGRTGQPQVFTKAYGTQGFNSFASLQQAANPVSTSESLKSIVLGVAAPPIQIAGRSLFDRPYDSKSLGRYALGQTVRQIPGVSVVAPSGGKSPDSIPIISEKDKVYSSGRKRNGKTIPLPYDFRPGARAETGWQGALERYLFGGVYDVPAQGPIHRIEQKKHIGAVAKKARQR